jgi:hypothetical protein
LPPPPPPHHHHHHHHHHTHAHLPTPAFCVLRSAGAVLLKNTWGGGGLPLRRTSVRSLALIGPNANNSRGQLCSYYNEYGPCGGWGAVITPLGAFLATGLPSVDYAPGCHDTSCSNASLVPAAVAGE